MDFTGLALPIWALLLVGLCIMVLVAVLGMGLFTLALKIGVIINESRKPPHRDSGDYRIGQGAEVRPEERGRSQRDAS